MIQEYKLGVWCMSAAVGFDYIRNTARSVVLASGTLAPLSSFSLELGCPFQNTLEANHVINAKEQVQRVCSSYPQKC